MRMQITVMFVLIVIACNLAKIDRKHLLSIVEHVQWILNRSTLSYATHLFHTDSISNSKFSNYDIF